MKNLSGPVHCADQSLRQTLRDRLAELPAVPKLEPEAATVQIEQLVPHEVQDTAREKRDS